MTTAYERGWSGLKNGELLETAEKQGFEVLITTDSNLKYQQSMKSRLIAIVVLSTPSWPRIRRAVAKVLVQLTLLPKEATRKSKSREKDD